MLRKRFSAANEEHKEMEVIDLTVSKNKQSSSFYDRLIKTSATDSEEDEGVARNAKAFQEDTFRPEASTKMEDRNSSTAITRQGDFMHSAFEETKIEIEICSSSSQSVQRKKVRINAFGQNPPTNPEVEISFPNQKRIQPSSAAGPEKFETLKRKVELLPLKKPAQQYKTLNTISGCPMKFLLFDDFEVYGQDALI